MKPNKPEAANATQGGAALLEPETTDNQDAIQHPYGIPGDPNDESAWLANHREGDNTAIETYPFVPGFDKSQWHFREFRADEVVKYGRQLKAAGFVIVQKDSGIMGQPFADWLEPHAFTEFPDGVVGRGHDYDKVRRAFERDLVLCVQPIGAHTAQEKIRSLAWAEYLKSRLTKEQEELATKIGKSGKGAASARDTDAKGRSLNAESRTGWDALG